MSKMNEAELDMATMAQMALHGSPFIRRMGVALGFALPDEVRAMQTAFPHVWETYREMARRAELSPAAQRHALHPDSAPEPMPAPVPDVAVPAV